MRKLTIEEKIQVIEMAINKGRNADPFDAIFMCNLIKESAKDLKFLYTEYYSRTIYNSEIMFLNNNFSELCLISNKFLNFQISHQYNESGFCFDGRPWFDGNLQKDLKISILNELLKFYKNLKDGK